MRIRNFFDSFIKNVGPSPSAEAIVQSFNLFPEGEFLRSLIEDWEVDLAQTAEWMSHPEYGSRLGDIREFIRVVPRIVSHVEGIFGMRDSGLPGEIWLCPSLRVFDGFARYDSGAHRVILGVDHPDADAAYLRALMAHELSHVFRDHQPEVWSHLGKPLQNLSRAEYLEEQTAVEHLVSEGLATLFSQFAYPDVPLQLHHYYEEHEWQWCLDHHAKIDRSLRSCLQIDQDVWSFYAEGRVGLGSPSRTQYYWAAHIIREWLERLAPGRYGEILVQAHSWSASRFTPFL